MPVLQEAELLRMKAKTIRANDRDYQEAKKAVHKRMFEGRRKCGSRVGFDSALTDEVTCKKCLNRS